MNTRIAPTNERKDARANRDRILTAAGFHVSRVTWWELTTDADPFIAEVRSVRGRRLATRGAPGEPPKIEYRPVRITDWQPAVRSY